MRHCLRGLSSLSSSGFTSRTCAVLGSQWGDEGKGKLVDVLAAGYDVVARFNGGANAGHTLVVDGKRFAFHLLPCGLLRPGCVNVVGGGVVVHLPTLEKELAAVRESGVEVDGSRLKVSDRAHLLFDFHQLVDGMRETELAEKSRQIGTTGKGIGPCYASKIVRNGIRVADLVHGDWEEFKMKYQALLEFFKRQHRFDFDGKEEMQRLEMQREMLREFVDDTAFYINDAYRCGKRILMEGANAAMLDIDFGTYPYVTSSSTTVGGISTGLGLSPDKIEACVGVVKAYTTRVGGGPFPTELHDAVGKHLGEVGREFGTTTGRRRRCGWLDIPVVQYTSMLNGYSSLNLTKLDVLTGLEELKIGYAYELNGQILAPGQMPSTLSALESVKVLYETLPGWSEDISQCRSFEQLPATAQKYLKRIEELTGVPISWIGVGAGRLDMATQGFKL